MAFTTTTVDMSKPEGMFTIGAVPICYQHEFMLGPMPYGYSFVPIVQVKDGSFQLAHVMEEPQEEPVIVPKIIEVPIEEEVKEEEGALLPQKKVHSSPALSPKRRRSNRRMSQKRMATRKVYVPAFQDKRTFKKVQSIYQNELDIKPNIPVNNSFAPLHLVKMNSHKAELKAMKEFPPEYHTQFWDRSPQIKQTIKEKVIFPCTLVHERLGRNESKRKSTPVKKRRG